jgi:Membrane bound O-acyl transferase family
MTNLRYESHLHLISEREREFDKLFRSGAFSPLLLQHVLGTFVLLTIPLVIRHTSFIHSRLLRYGFHAIITALSLYTIREVRFLGPANGYAVGLITTWFYIWSSTILIANDAQKDFKRIEKEHTKIKGSKEVIQKIYRWQPYPQKLSHRVDWVCDLIFNFRGPNWNWRLRSLPLLPEAVIRDTEPQAPFSKPKESKLMACKPSVRLQYAFRSFLRDYIALDFLKLLLMRDPYFWGFVDNPLPPPWPFDMLAFSPALIRVYRLTASVSAVLFALDIITSLNPIFFLGLSLAFPGLSRTVTHQPLDEAWLYPESFGPVAALLDHGLIGAWNSWWHQLFRFGFSECSRFISDMLLLPSDQKGEKNGVNNKNNNGQKYTSFHKLTRRILHVMLVFSLSGLVHAMGSYTTFAESKPWNAFLFFFIQGVGVLTQTFFEVAIIPKVKPFISSSPLPRWLVRTTNLSVVVLWFYFTGPLIADDFSRSGIWMFEPLPYSPLRGVLRLGVEDDQWFCWRGAWFEWWSGDAWWQSGIRLT